MTYILRMNDKIDVLIKAEVCDMNYITILRYQEIFINICLLRALKSLWIWNKRTALDFNQKLSLEMSPQNVEDINEDSVSWSRLVDLFASQTSWPEIAYAGGQLNAYIDILNLNIPSSRISGYPDADWVCIFILRILFKEYNQSFVLLRSPEIMSFSK